jgi:hypothetical protein
MSCRRVIGVRSGYLLVHEAQAGACLPEFCQSSAGSERIGWCCLDACVLATDCWRVL